MRRELLILQAIDRAGWRDAMKGLTFLAEYGIVREDLGHSVTMAEFCEWWNQSTPKAYRDWASFRRCVNEGVEVEDVWQRVKRQAEFREGEKDARKLAGRLRRVSV